MTLEEILAQLVIFWNQILVWLEPLTTHPDFIKIAFLPIVAGIVGMSTNWLAMQMTFHPVEPIGWPPFFGWQGIIPMKMEKMAGILVDNTLTKLGSLDEFFREMEPEKIAEHIAKATNERLEEYTDEVMTEKNAVLWENLPQAVKKRVYSRIRRQIPILMDGLVQDITVNIEQLVDLKQMITAQLNKEKDLMNRVFKEVGAPEFHFVVMSGLWFGIMFGIIQVPFFIIYPDVPWILPVFGTLVGTATNWLALNLIFRPLNPIRIGPWKLQGLFLKRQEDVAAHFARIATTEMITIKNLMETVMTGPKSHRTKAMIKKHMRPFLEGGVVRTAAQLTVGPTGYVNLKKRIESMALDLSIEPFDDPVFNRERGRVVEKLMKERMIQMTPAEYQDLLRPAFKEDEWILVAIGGVLGFITGCVQLVVVFGKELPWA